MSRERKTDIPRDGRITDSELERLHTYSSENRHAISGSATAGCFYCLEIWEPAGMEIAEWCDKDEDAPDKLGNATAMCPFCHIDSVLASINVAPITIELLQEMNEYWF